MKTRYSQETRPPFVDNDTVVLTDGCVSRDEGILLFCLYDLAFHVFGIREEVPVELSAHSLGDDERMIVRRTMGRVADKIRYGDDRYYILEALSDYHTTR